MSIERTDSDIETAAAAELAAGRVPLAHCTECGVTFWHPRAHCPSCGSRRVELTPSAGPARVYAATVNRRPRAGKEADPVQVGYVEFPQGVRVLTTLAFPDGNPEIGAEVVAQSGGPGEPAIVFRPVQRG